MTSNDTVRRTWDKEEYRLKSKQRESGFKKRISEREVPNEFVDLAKAREQALGLEGDINKIRVISAKDEASKGFRCDICGVSFNDNLSYLDHLNSFQHLKALGLNARIKRSTIEEVRARLLARKERTKELNVKEKIELQKKNEAEEWMRLKELKKKEKEDSRKEFEDEDVSKLMGFGGFNSSKKN
jgi:U4/U6.U5 tri-snRNP component SNU23